MQVTEITFFKNGESQCSCWCPESHSKQLIQILTYLCRIVTLYMRENYQIETKTKFV